MASLAEVPFLVIDIETTGFAPGVDAIVEIAAVLVLGDRPPKRVYETLIDPERPIPDGQVHGVTDTMVAGAPRFAEAMPGLRAAMANRVLVSHRHGQLLHAPWLCTRRLPRLAGFGPGDLPLWYACLRQGITLAEQRTHRAAEDALATARLLQAYRLRIEAAGITTLDALAQRFRFERAADAAERLLYHPLPPPEMLVAPTNAPQHRREPPQPRPAKPLQRYLEATVEVLEDLVVDDDEIGRLRALREALDVSPEAARRIYERIWQVAMARFEEDGVIDEVEARHIEALRVGFDRLGWRPPAR